MNLLAIDPGLANTGLVLFEGRRVARALTVRSKAGATCPQFGPCVTRVEHMAAEIAEATAEWPRADVLACESYKDIPGHLRAAKNRWTTPLTVGLLVPVLRSLTDSGEIVWQDPETVMTAYAQAMRLWALGQHGICPGDEVLRNEHLRSAAAHGLHYLAMQKTRR